MNIIYKELIPKLLEIKIVNNEESIKADEQLIQSTINNVISNFKIEVDNY